MDSITFDNTFSIRYCSIMALTLYAKTQLTKLDISFIRKIDEKVLLNFMMETSAEENNNRRELTVWGCSQLSDIFDEYAGMLTSTWKVYGRIPKILQ